MTEPTTNPTYQRRPRPRRGFIIAIAAVLVVLAGATVAAFTAFGGGSSPASSDPGLAFCKSAAEGNNWSSNGGGNLTKGEYQKLRAKLSTSKYADIRTPSVKMIDLVWQISGSGDASDNAALSLGRQFVSAYTDAATACQNHGYTIPPLPSLQ